MSLFWMKMIRRAARSIVFAFPLRERGRFRIKGFERNIGKPVQAELNSPPKGEKKKFTGTLLAFDSSMVIIEGRKEKYELARAEIKTIRPYIGP